MFKPEKEISSPGVVLGNAPNKVMDFVSAMNALEAKATFKQPVTEAERNWCLELLFGALDDKAAIIQERGTAVQSILTNGRRASDNAIKAPIPILTPDIDLRVVISQSDVFRYFALQTRESRQRFWNYCFDAAKIGGRNAKARQTLEKIELTFNNSRQVDVRINGTIAGIDSGSVEEYSEMYMPMGNPAIRMLSPPFVVAFKALAASEEYDARGATFTAIKDAHHATAVMYKTSGTYRDHMYQHKQKLMSIAASLRDGGVTNITHIGAGIKKAVDIAVHHDLETHSGRLELNAAILEAVRDDGRMPESTRTTANQRLRALKV